MSFEDDARVEHGAVRLRDGLAYYPLDALKRPQMRSPLAEKGRAWGAGIDAEKMGRTQQSSWGQLLGLSPEGRCSVHVLLIDTLQDLYLRICLWRAEEEPIRMDGRSRIRSYQATRQE
jgi:hypothetical protein